MGKKNQRKDTIINSWLAIVLAIGLPLFVSAQQPTLSTTLTKNQLLIGEQSTLKIKANFPSSAYTVNWFTLPDSMPHFEVVTAGPIDTVTNNGVTQLEQQLVFTGFDSGQWVTPPLAIQFKQQGGSNTLTLYADTMPYSVGFVADTTAEIRDVKPIIEEELFTGWPWYYWAAIGVGLLVVLLLLAWLLYRYLSKKPPVIISSQNAYQQVMQQLAALQDLNLAIPSECRLFHTKLAQLFKEYMGHKLGTVLTNKTTSDTLLHLKDAGLSSEQLATIGAALRGCDAVKFAKFMPNAAQCMQWYNDIKQVIEQTEKQRTVQS